MQTKLLKVLEDKRVTFESSYYDEHDPGVPAYVKKLFADGAPADFILIGATTRDPDAIDAAIRSRCAAVYFEPLTQAQVIRIVEEAAERLGTKIAKSVPALIASYTIEGRKAVQILADAHGHALYRQGARTRALMVRDEDVIDVVQAGRLVAAHARARAARQGNRQDARLGRHALRRIDHRDRSGGVSGPGTAQRRRALQRYRRLDVARLGLQRDGRSCARWPGSIRPTSTCTSTSSAAATSTGRRRGLAFFLALYSALDENAVAAGRRGHRRSLDRRQRARDRRRRRKAVCGAARPGCARSSFPKRTRVRSRRRPTASRSFRLRRSPMRSPRAACAFRCRRCTRARKSAR